MKTASREPPKRKDWIGPKRKRAISWRPRRRKLQRERKMTRMTATRTLQTTTQMTSQMEHQSDPRWPGAEPFARKKYKRRKRRATENREDIILKLPTSQAKAFDEMAVQTSEKRKEDKAKSSLLVGWTDREKKGFSIISAKTYGVTGHPPYNAFVKKASKDKKAQKSLSQIEDISLEEHWGGMASPSGLVHIFAKGMRSVNFLESPTGFSAFICFP
jgi:hypothetical protein